MNKSIYLASLAFFSASLFSMSQSNETRSINDHGKRQDTIDYELYKAVESKNAKRVKELVALGADPMVTFGDVPIFELRPGAFHKAAFRGDAACLEALLQSPKTNIYACYMPSGDNALHLAAAGGSGTCVKILLAAGVPIDVANRDGKYPLDRAVERKFIRMAKLLLQAGAPLFFGESKSNQALCRAAYQNNIEMVKALSVGFLFDLPSQEAVEDAQNNIKTLLLLFNHYGINDKYLQAKFLLMDEDLKNEVGALLLYSLHKGKTDVSKVPVFILLKKELVPDTLEELKFQFSKIRTSIRLDSRYKSSHNDWIFLSDEMRALCDSDAVERNFKELLEQKLEEKFNQFKKEDDLIIDEKSDNNEELDCNDSNN